MERFVEATRELPARPDAPQRTGALTGVYPALAAEYDDAYPAGDERMAPAVPIAAWPASRMASRSAVRKAGSPNSAAEEPRKTKKSVNIHPRVLIFQSSGVGSVMP